MAREFRAFIAILCLTAYPWSPHGAEAAAACHRQTEEILQRLKLTPDAIKGSSVVPRRESHRGGWVIKGYDVWIRLKACEGALILDFTQHCRERQVYTRGACELTGVKSF